MAGASSGMVNAGNGSVDGNDDDARSPVIGNSGCILNKAAVWPPKFCPGSAVLYAMLHTGLDLHQPWRAENHGKSFTISPTNRESEPKCEEKNLTDKSLGPIHPLKIVEGQSCTRLTQALDLFVVSTSETTQI
jgi:hypothetical protein